MCSWHINIARSDFCSEVGVGPNKTATYGGDAMTWRLIRITRLALRSNNDRTKWKLLDLLVEQIGAEHHWIKVEQLFEYQTYFAGYSICCKCVPYENLGIVTHLTHNCSKIVFPGSRLAATVILMEVLSQACLEFSLLSITRLLQTVLLSDFNHKLLQCKHLQ